jgi:hypothetical protein
MLKYKTVVTDYEGMQGLLDTHAGQGWRLFSVTPDTWRKSAAPEDGESRAPFEELDTRGKATQEYSASYYLLVFQRDDIGDYLERQSMAEEPLPLSSLPPFDEFSP